MCSDRVFCVATGHGELCPEWQGDAFLTENLEATTMHEPLPYPTSGLEWPDKLSGTDVDK